MNRTVTIEIIDTAAMRFLRDLAAISLIRFIPKTAPEIDQTSALINKICEEEDTSIDPFLTAAQAQAIGREDW